jgi:hypothetical protein
VARRAERAPARVSVRSESIDHLLDLLSTAAIDDHQGILGVDDDNVVQPDERNDPVRLEPDHAVGSIDLEEMPSHGVPQRVALDQLAQPMPITAIRPQRRSLGTTATRWACSITPLSIVTFGISAQRSAVTVSRSGVSQPSRIQSTPVAMVGSCLSNSWRRVLTVQTNMPAFQRKPPESTYSVARARSGFSTNRAAR